MDEPASDRLELEKEGWLMRTVTDEPRLSEMIELYEELDFEVLVLPILSEDCGGCTVCFDSDPSRYKTIFTRKKQGRRSVHKEV